MTSRRKGQVARAVGEAKLLKKVRDLEKTRLADSAALADVKVQLATATRRLHDLRRALDGRPVYRHVFVGDAAKQVADAMFDAGITRVEAFPNGVLEQVD